MNKRKVVLIDINSLSTIEGHDPGRVTWLKNKILAENLWTVPLKVEITRGLIMDGHHRYEVAKILGLCRVPGEYFTYNDVDVWSLREGINVSSEIIMKNHDARVIFPYKTAKHRFYGDDPKFEGVMLDELK